MDSETYQPLRGFLEQQKGRSCHMALSPWSSEVKTGLVGAFDTLCPLLDPKSQLLLLSSVTWVEQVELVARPPACQLYAECDTELVTQPEQGSPRTKQASVAVDWAGVSEMPPLHVNQIAAQIGVPTADGMPDGLYLLLGAVAPPLIFGKDEEAQRREIEAVGSIPVTVHGRFHLSRARLSELIDILVRAAENYDTVAKGLGGAMPSGKEG